jgi:integrase
LQPERYLAQQNQDIIMSGSAKILAGGDLCRLLAFTEMTRYPSRNQLMVLLSFKAGLRACEIGGLSWPMVLSAGQRIGSEIILAASITKGRKPRRVPMNPALRSAMRLHWQDRGRPTFGPVIQSERGRAMCPAAVVNWFANAFDHLGMPGCSSHSGRRTFITQAARLLAQTGGSLRDVQELAGHAALSTTERYIQGDRDIQRRLIKLI